MTLLVGQALYLSIETKTSHPGFLLIGWIKRWVWNCWHPLCWGITYFWGWHLFQQVVSWTRWTALWAGKHSVPHFYGLKLSLLLLVFSSSLPRACNFMYWTRWGRFLRKSLGYSLPFFTFSIGNPHFFQSSWFSLMPWYIGWVRRWFDTPHQTLLHGWWYFYIIFSSSVQKNDHWVICSCDLQLNWRYRSLDQVWDIVRFLTQPICSKSAQ